jgi:hypothetical protein
MKAERAGKAIGSLGSFGLKLVDNLRTREYPEIEIAQIERFDSARQATDHGPAELLERLQPRAPVFRE